MQILLRDLDRDRVSTRLFWSGKKAKDLERFFDHTFVQGERPVLTFWYDVQRLGPGRYRTRLVETPTAPCAILEFHGGVLLKNIKMVQETDLKAQKPLDLLRIHGKTERPYPTLAQTGVLKSHLQLVHTSGLVQGFPVSSPKMPSTLQEIGPMVRRFQRAAKNDWFLANNARFSWDISRTVDYLLVHRKIRSRHACYAIVTAALSNRPDLAHVTLKMGADRWLEEVAALKKQPKIAEALAVFERSPKKAIVALSFIHEVFAYLKTPSSSSSSSTPACAPLDFADNFMLALLVTRSCHCRCFTQYALAAAEELGLASAVVPVFREAKEDEKYGHVLVGILDPSQELEEPEGQENCPPSPSQDQDQEQEGRRNKTKLETLLQATPRSWSFGEAVRALACPIVFPVLATVEGTEKFIAASIKYTRDLFGKDFEPDAKSLLVEKMTSRSSSWSHVCLELIVIGTRYSWSPERVQFELTLLALLHGWPPETFAPLLVGKTRQVSWMASALPLQAKIVELLGESPDCEQVVMLFEKLVEATLTLGTRKTIRAFDYSRAKPPTIRQSPRTIRKHQEN